MPFKLTQHTQMLVSTVHYRYCYNYYNNNYYY